MLELAVTIKPPSQPTDDLKVTRGELPCHNQILKHLNEKIHLRILTCPSESVISS